MHMLAESSWWGFGMDFLSTTINRAVGVSFMKRENKSGDYLHKKLYTLNNHRN